MPKAASERDRVYYVHFSFEDAPYRVFCPRGRSLAIRAKRETVDAARIDVKTRRVCVCVRGDRYYTRLVDERLVPSIVGWCNSVFF